MASLKMLFRRKWKQLTVRKALLICALSVVIFNEYLIYTIQRFRWSSMPKRDPDDDMVILLVADSQMIGYQEEQGFPFGMLARWDCDRYLKNTFSRAHSYSDPDLIVFLGDIMDEGSEATKSEYDSYMNRFRSTFYQTQYTKTIAVPGDNDIGGEGGDFRTPFKVNRFEEHFENLTGLVSHKFIDFLKLDIEEDYDAVHEKKQLITSMASRLKNPLKIIVNHESMTTNFKSTIYPIVKLAQPSLMFSGHWHLSQMYTCDTCLSNNADLRTWPYEVMQLEYMDGFIDIDLSNSLALKEIVVPTCSYRMGVPNMGYGVAVINKMGSMKYSVIWLPSRYIVLKAYVIAFIIITAIFLIDFILSPLKTSTTLFS